MLKQLAAAVLLLSLSASAVPTYTPQYEFTSSDGAAGDNFGNGMWLENGIAVVGAPDHNGNQGEAYVFSCDVEAQCTQTLQLTAPDGVSGDYFGFEMFIAGSLVASTAPLRGGNVGALYMFDCTNATECTYGGVYVPAEASAGDYTGSSVAISGTIVYVGAYGFSNYQGALYTYACPTAATCTFGAQLLAVDGVQGDYFGYWVTASGSLMATSAPFRNSNAGGAYVYSCLSATSCTLGTNTVPADVSAGDGFGSFLDISGSFLLVSAPNQNSFVGATYVYTCTTNAVCTQTQKITAPDGQPNDQFGNSLSIGDTNSLILIGAQGYNNLQGKVYLYSCPTADTCLQGGIIVAADGVAGDEFGFLSNIYGDIVIISSVLHNNYQGAVYSWLSYVPVTVLDVYTTPFIPSPNQTVIPITDVNHYRDCYINSTRIVYHKEHRFDHHHGHEHDHDHSDCGHKNPKDHEHVPAILTGHRVVSDTVDICCVSSGIYDGAERWPGDGDRHPGDRWPGDGDRHPGDRWPGDGDRHPGDRFPGWPRNGKRFVRPGDRLPGDRRPGDRLPGDRPGDRLPGDRHPGDRHPGDRHPGDRLFGGDCVSRDCDIVRHEREYATYRNESAHFGSRCLLLDTCYKIVQDELFLLYTGSLYCGEPAELTTVSAEKDSYAFLTERARRHGCGFVHERPRWPCPGERWPGDGDRWPGDGDRFPGDGDRFPGDGDRFPGDRFPGWPRNGKRFVRPGDRLPGDRRPGDRLPGDRPGDRLPGDRPGDRLPGRDDDRDCWPREGGRPDMEAFDRSPFKFDSAYNVLAPYPSYSVNVAGVYYGCLFRGIYHGLFSRPHTCEYTIDNALENTCEVRTALGFFYEAEVCHDFERHDHLDGLRHCYAECVSYA